MPGMKICCLMFIPFQTCACLRIRQRRCGPCSSEATLESMPFCRLAALLFAIFLIAPSAHAASPCAEFAAKLPNLSKALCEAAKLQPSGARSVAGQMLWTRDIRPAQAHLRVLVVGGIHGDELSAASLPFHWIKLAAQNAPGTGNSVPAIHWRFVPVLNPDGLLSQPASRVNAHGVDLNRNFPTPDWSRDAKIYWEKRTGKDPRRWPGPSAMSEPETRFLHDQMQRFKPDLIVSIHAPYGMLDFDGPSVPPTKLGRLYLDQVGIFPGSLGNYGGVFKGVPVVTIELPNATQTPLDSEISDMWHDLLRWTSERVGVAQDVPVRPRGRETLLR
jgi:murein peptide amidase A